jgi:ABC-type lipoprotein release transport system permease subunit
MPPHPWLQRQRYLVDFTVGALGRRKGRNLALVAVYALIVFVLASVLLFSQALRHEAATLLSGAPEVTVQRLVAGRHDLIPGTYLERLGKVRGVTDARGRLWGYYYDPVVAANYTLLVSPDDPPPAGKIRVGSTLATTRGLGVGDVLSLRGHDGQPYAFTVDATLSPDSALLTADLILVNEQDFRAFFGIPTGLYTDLILTVPNPREVTKVAEKVLRALPDTRPIVREEILRTYAALFDWREGMVMVLLSGAVLAFIIFAWDKASGLSAEERREIGVLKAIGWETSDVMAMKLWEGLLISVFAFLLGYLAAYVHVFGLAAALFGPVLKGWSVLYPDFQLSPHVEAFQVFTLFFLTVFPYALATVVPVWRAAIADPDAVMRL